MSVSRGDTLSKTYLKTGEKIKFNVSLNEQAFVVSNSNSPTKVSFKVGSNTFYATCDTSTSSSTNVLTCTHTVAGGYVGSIISSS